MFTIIYQHLGLGDIILCNGLIRHLISIKNNSKKSFLICKNSNLNSAKFMYRDIKNLKIIGINEKKNEKNEVNLLLKKFEKKEINYIKIGHEFYVPTEFLNINNKGNRWPCDIVFYKQFNVPFKFRYTKSFWKRDLPSEKKLLNKLTDKKKYAFIHDDVSRGLIIGDKYIGNNLKVIRNNNNELIFNYGLLLENADEIHVMESSFRQLMETLNIKTKKLFLYKGRDRYHAIPLQNKATGKLIGTRFNWKVINSNIINKKKWFFSN
jgi:hypothetical protein